MKDRGKGRTVNILGEVVRDPAASGLCRSRDGEVDESNDGGTPGRVRARRGLDWRGVDRPRVPKRKLIEGIKELRIVLQRPRPS